MHSADGDYTTTRLQVQARRRHVCRAAYEPFPFHEEDYYRADLALVSSTLGMPGPTSGHLVMMRQPDQPVLQTTPDTPAMVLVVGGDTLAAIADLVQGPQGILHTRPMALDLLWQVLQRGQEISKRDWRLLRIAVVDMRNNIFIGRLFFGDADSGAVVWDCDCRPSDAVWLALKTDCPIYIKKTVWNLYSSPIGQMLAPEGKTLEASVYKALGITPASPTEQQTAQKDAFLQIRESDPEPVKRLKMEMKVALHEEDYTTAARIRDHPFMKLQAQIQACLSEGRREDAAALEADLHAAIAEAMKPDYSE
ncbi:hypothetical protein WJX72_005385 [[Myrmecia] bisecta]|uniref:BFN domain-containing protein n=1 Tax=[Myrmecia] bisecta TaxID=41462 RepID=A0AAW1QAK6_9CHLO